MDENSVTLETQDAGVAMTVDTTPQIVDTGAAVADPVEDLAPRDSLEEAMAKRLQERRKAEAEGAAEAAEPQPQPEPEPAAEPPPQTLKLKINGREIDATPDDVIRLAQKAAGADRKFEEAARLRREAEEILARAQQAGQQPPATPAAAAPAVDIDKLADDLAYGDRDKIREALQAITAAPAPAFDPAAIQRTVAETIALQADQASSARAWGEALAAVPEIASNQVMAATLAVVAKDEMVGDIARAFGADPAQVHQYPEHEIAEVHRQLRISGNARSQQQILTAATDVVKKTYLGNRGPDTAAATIQARRDQKAAAPQAVKPSPIRSTAPVPVVKTGSDYVAQERAARGR